jgi:hypothetical protein
LNSGNDTACSDIADSDDEPVDHEASFQVSKTFKV